MTTITINKRFLKAAMETNEDGSTPTGYWGYVLSGGKTVARIAGVIEVVPGGCGFGVDGLRFDGNIWTVWQALNFAQKGQHGLSVVKGAN